MNRLRHLAFASDTCIRWITLVPIFILVAYLASVAVHLKIDYHDSYFVLLNARCIATKNSLGYTGYRPIILPILLSPFLYLEKLISNSEFIFAACHLAMVGFFTLLLWVTYRFFRLQFETKTALLGIFFFAFNALLIHSAPYCKEDVVSLLFVTSGFYLYLKSNRTKKLKYYFLSGCLIALAIGARFNNPVLFSVIALYELLSGQTRFCTSLRKLFLEGERVSFKIFVFLIFPILLFILILSLHYSTLGLSTFRGAFHKYLTEPLVVMANIVRTEYYVTPAKNMIFLVKSCGWPVIACAFIGILSNLKKLQSTTLFCFLWFLVFFIFQTFMIHHKEARFLIPLFPPLYFFAVRGGEAIIHLAERFYSKSLSPQILRALVVILFFAVPAKKAIAECIQWRDPVYRVNFAKEISMYSSGLAKNNPVYWVGHFYPVHPKRYIFDMEDVTFYIYHFYVNAIAFYTKNYNIRTLNNAQFLLPTLESQPLWVGPNAGGMLNDGDVLIVNAEKDSYNTQSLPNKLNPVFVERARKLIFEPMDPPNVNLRHYQSNSAKNTSLITEIVPGGFLISGQGIPDGRYEIYLELENPNVAVSAGLADANGGSIQFLNKNFPENIKIKRLFLFYFDSVKRFSLPK